MTSVEQQGPTEVELPDGTIVEFPPGMSQDAMKQALQKKFPPSATYGQYMNAARNADAAGDEVAAKRLVQLAQQTKTASQIPPAPTELAAFSKAALSGNAPTPVPERNELLGGVLPSPRQAARNLKDNLLGDDDANSLIRGERIGAAINKAGESLTLGFIGDETSAAVAPQ